MNYDVYAMGNAMVDYEIEINDQFLEEHHVEKGLMTLVDEERQNELLGSAGDHIRKKQSGGSAANSIFALSQLGGKGYYSCKVANDEDGQFYAQELSTHGIDSNLNHEELQEGTTGKCLVMVSPDSERTMNTYLGITSDFSVNELDSDAISSSKYLFIEGYLISSDQGREAMKQAREIADENGVKVSLTFSDPSMVKYFGAEMKKLLSKKIDLLFCNEEEAMLFTGGKTLDEAIETLKNYSDHFVITLGKKGAKVFDGQNVLNIASYPTIAVDSTGAGDVFSGAFLYGITNDLSYSDSGNLASLSASQIVSKYGPRLEQNQIEKIIKEVKGGNK